MQGFSCSSLLLLLVFCTTFSFFFSSSQQVLFSQCTNQSSPLQLHGSFNLTLSSLLTSLNLSSSSRLYHFNSSAPAPGSNLSAMYQCRGDSTPSQCSQCVSQALTAAAQSCPNGAAYRADLDPCTLLYKNDTIAADFSQLFGLANTNNNTDATFRSNRDAVLKTVSTAAPANGGYNSSYNGGSVSEGVYALAQCHGYLSEFECLQCLSSVSNVQRIFGDQMGGREYYGSCYYRFETSLFYSPQSPVALGPASPPPSDSLSFPEPNSNTAKSVNRLLVAGLVAVSSLLIVVFCIASFQRMGKSWQRPRFADPDPGPQDSLELQSRLQYQFRLFSLEEMKIATNNFHDGHKLGEGGFGSVYRGAIEDGQVVAIKKLSRPSQQGERQFLSEIKLITTLQHRNLIRLLGCCVEDSERLLVYEYFPNQSLDKHLFDQQGRTWLSWNIRREIILGTSRGLAYLHHDAHLRIVHRDIKTSNILLDDKLHPKIADFGLARLFSISQTHISTQIAGTLGYLAPEYAMHGRLTEKSDIFSFGVVILEIISGRRVMDIHLHEEQHVLLNWTWRLFQEQRQLELVDPLLNNNYLMNEAIRYIHVALLCTQAVAGLRPNMNKVIALLDGQSEILDIPTKPAFLPSSFIESEDERDNDDSQNHQENAPLYVPPMFLPSTSTSSPSPSSSCSTPLISNTIENIVTSISDVPDPR